jgi:hypothetical protein
MANHSFIGQQFRLKQQGKGLSTPVVVLPNESVIVTEHIPGGNTDISQDLGRRGSVERTYRVIVAAADFAAFVALQGQTGTLALINNPARTATLRKVSEEWDSYPEGFYEGDATWLIG